MIITKTPLRMSYVGGGSDLSSYYRQYGGAVISSAVNAIRSLPAEVTVSLRHGVLEISSSFSSMSWCFSTSSISAFFWSSFLNKFKGKGTINILDVTGKVVTTKTVNVNNLVSVDVSEISNGNYIFDLNLEDGRSAKLNIIINK